MVDSSKWSEKASTPTVALENFIVHPTRISDKSGTVNAACSAASATWMFTLMENQRHPVAIPPLGFEQWQMRINALIQLKQPRLRHWNIKQNSSLIIRGTEDFIKRLVCFAPC